MSKMVALVSALVAALVLAVAGPGSEQGLSPHPAEARMPALTVTVACEAAPERTRVENHRNRNITIKTVGSIYQPRSNEPFRTNYTLRARGSVVFESGYDASRNELTGQYIYENDVGSREGARVTTTSGARFVDRCG